MTPRRTLALLAAATLSGCLFDFRNPAEALRAGQVGGTVLADVAGSGTPAPKENVAVSLKGAAFDQASRPNGRFVVLDLPAGRHRLLFRDGTTWALERDVELAYGSDGQPEGIELGDVVLRYSAAVEGSVSLPSGTIASGVAVDESSGLTAPLVVGTDSIGNPVPPATFRFPMLALGTHLIKLSAIDTLAGPWVGGQVVVDVTLADQGTTISLANVVAKAATLTGRLRFKVQAIGLALSPTQVQVLLTPDPLGLNPITPASDGSVDVTVPEGLYAIALVPPATAAPLPRRVPAGPAPLASFGPLAAAAPVPTVGPPQVFGVVISGKVAEVGSVYVASDSTIVAALSTCRSDADCGGTTCSASSCVGRVSTPPPVAAGINFCPSCLWKPFIPTGGTQSPCDVGPGVPGVCGCPPARVAAGTCFTATTTAPPEVSTCLPGAVCYSCTPDGLSRVTGKPQSGSCP
jgi:hypothetical protein